MRYNAVLIKLVGFCLLLASLLVLIIQLTTVSAAEVRQERPVEPLYLTLSSAINLALKNNRTLLGSTYSLESQKLSLDSALSQFDVRIAPSTFAGINDVQNNLSAGLSFKKKFTIGPEASISPGIGWSSSRYTKNIGFSLEIPLFRGFGKTVNLDSIFSSRFSIQNAERSHYLSQVSVVLKTVFDVYDILKQKGLVLLSESQVRRLNGHAETARIKERVGLTTQIDVYRAEIRMRDAQNSLTLARESLRSAEDRLKITLAIPLEKKIQVDAPLEYKRVEMAEVHAIKTALKNRVKLDQAAGDIQEAKRKAGIAKNNLLPGLNLLMGYERLDSPEEIGQALGLEDERWSVTLISSTDWARKAEKASYSQSLINVKNARLDLEIKKDEIKREVRQGLEALKKTEERINIRKDQIHQAEGKLAISNVKFKYNMANNFDIIEAETELQQARVNLLSAKTDYITGTYRMRAALGTLIEH